MPQKCTVVHVVFPIIIRINTITVFPKVISEEIQKRLQKFSGQISSIKYSDSNELTFQFKKPESDPKRKQSSIEQLYTNF